MMPGLSGVSVHPIVSSHFQVSATYADGYRATAVCPVGGPFASLKAKRVGEALIKR